MNPRYYLVVLFAIVLAACGGKNQTPVPEMATPPVDTTGTPAMPTENKTVSKAKAITWPELDPRINHKQVTIEGFLRLPNTMYMDADIVEIDLFERPNQSAGNKLVCRLPIGTGINTTAKLNERYRTEDFIITDDNGARMLGEGAYVRLTGTLSIYEKGYGFLHDITKIVRVAHEPETFDGRRIPQLDLKNADAFDKKLVYAVGKLEPGDYLSTYNNSYAFLLKGPETDTSSYLIANIIIGHGRSQMKPVPANYKNKDIDIRDGSGGVFPISREVKVFGTFLKSNFHPHSGSLFVEQIVVQ